MAEQSTLGHFVLKNTLDIPDDTVLFDPINDNPISFFKNVLAARATPNTFRTRKRFYGRFITQLYADGSAGKSGNGMWDDVISAFKRAGAESTQEMKLLVAHLNHMCIAERYLNTVIMYWSPSMTLPPALKEYFYTL